MFYGIVDEEAVTKVFWTSATKSGCAGQFVVCFVEGVGIKQLDYEKKILTSESGGSSVGVLSSSMLKITARTMPAETKLYLACQSSTRRSATYVNLADVIINFYFKCNKNCIPLCGRIIMMMDLF